MKNGMEAVADVLNCMVSKGTSGVCRVAHVLLLPIIVGLWQIKLSDIFAM